MSHGRNHGVPWTPTEDERLRAAHLEGRDPYDEARPLGRSTASIAHRLLKLGLAKLEGRGIVRVEAP